MIHVCFFQKMLAFHISVSCLWSKHHDTELKFIVHLEYIKPVK